MKYNLIFAISVLLISLSSCKKDRTCECTTNSISTYDDGNGVITTTNDPPSTQITNYKKVKKSDITLACGGNKYSGSQSYPDGSSFTYSGETKCTIK